MRRDRLHPPFSIPSDTSPPTIFWWELVFLRSPLTSASKLPGGSIATRWGKSIWWNFRRGTIAACARARRLVSRWRESVVQSGLILGGGRTWDILWWAWPLALCQKGQTQEDDGPSPRNPAQTSRLKQDQVRNQKDQRRPRKLTRIVVCGEERVLPVWSKSCEVSTVPALTVTCSGSCWVHVFRVAPWQWAETLFLWEDGAGYRPYRRGNLRARAETSVPPRTSYHNYQPSFRVYSVARAHKIKFLRAVVPEPLERGTSLWWITLCAPEETGPSHRNAGDVHVSFTYFPRFQLCSLHFIRKDNLLLSLFGMRVDGSPVHLLGVASDEGEGGGFSSIWSGWSSRLPSFFGEAQDGSHPAQVALQGTENR